MDLFLDLESNTLGITSLLKMPFCQCRVSFFLILCLPCELPFGLLLTLPITRTCCCPCVCASKFWCRQISQEKWIGIITYKPCSWKVGLCEVNTQISSHLDTVINLRCWMFSLPLVQSLRDVPLAPHHDLYSPMITSWCSCLPHCFWAWPRV